jgi:hypothetical protein
MRRFIAMTAAAAAVLVLAGCSVEPPEGTDGNLTNGWSAIAPAAPFKPAAGTCHEGVDSTGPLDSYHPIPCAELHDSETVAVATFTDPDVGLRNAVPTPDSDADVAAFRDCSKRVSAFLGGPWRRASMAVNVVLPTQQAWSGGARWYRCDIVHTDVNTGRPVSHAGTAAGGLLRSGDLALGCYNASVTGGSGRLSEVPCRRRHHAEFAGLWKAPTAMTYAQVNDDKDSAAGGCRPVIAVFADLPIDPNLQYRSGWIASNPTEREWARGERGVRCFLWVDDRWLTRTMAGAGPSALPIRFR